MLKTQSDSWVHILAVTLINFLPPCDSVSFKKKKKKFSLKKFSLKKVFIGIKLNHTCKVLSPVPGT